MLTIGVDAHKGVHVAVALDEAGREVARWRGPNSVEDWRQLAAWAAGLGDTCRWGIEGCPGRLVHPCKLCSLAPLPHGLSVGWSGVHSGRPTTCAAADERR